MKTKILSILALLLTVTQGAWAASVNCLPSDIGKVLGTDGKVYATVTAAGGMAKVSGMIAYVNGTTGIAIGPYDLFWNSMEGSGKMSVSSANSACSGYTSRTRPSAATTGWRLPSQADFNNMIGANGCQSANNLRNMIGRQASSCGCEAMKTDEGYWSSTSSSSGIYYNLWANNCNAIASQDNEKYVRPCFTFNVTPNYTISFNANGGSGSVASQTKFKDTNITLPSSGFTRSHYTLDGWATSSGGSKAYNLGASYSGNATTTLYAHWTPVNYTISYELDGGSVASENPTSYNIESAAITLNNPTKDGYTFAGWTGTGLGAATTTVTIAHGSTGNRSYTATWTPTYTATFAAGNDNEGWTIAPTSGVAGTSVTVSYSGENKVKSVTVKSIPSPVTLSTSSLSFTADDFSQDITVTRSGDGAITATSSDETVAKVTVSGNVVTVHRARGAEGSATITVSVAASDDFTAPADVTCSYTQTAMRTPANCTSTDKGRFLGQYGFLWPKDAAAYTSEELYAVVAYVGSCTNYFDKCLCVALEDISGSTLTNADAHTTLATWASSRDVNVWGTHYQTDNGGVYDLINGGVSWHPRTSSIVKGWRLPTVCDMRYLMNSYNGTSLTTPSEIYHGVSCGNFSDLRNAINSACGNTNFKNSAYGTGSRDSSNPSNVGTWQYSTGSTFYWAGDPDYKYYYRAVFAY